MVRMGKPWTTPHHSVTDPSTTTRRSTRKTSCELEMESHKKRKNDDTTSTEDTVDECRSADSSPDRNGKENDPDFKKHSRKLNNLNRSHSHRHISNNLSSDSSLLSPQTTVRSTRSSKMMYVDDDNQSKVILPGSTAKEKSDDDDDDEEQDPDHPDPSEENDDAVSTQSSEGEQETESEEDGYDPDAGVRRSARPHKLVRGSYNEVLMNSNVSWIVGGGGEAKGYTRTNSAGSGCRRSGRISGGAMDIRTNTDTEFPEEPEEEDMYSRVKRRRTSFSGGETSTKKPESRGRGRGRTLTLKDEEPVCRRLRDRNKLSRSESALSAFANSEPSKLQKWRAKHRKRRRHTSSSSSSSSSSDDVKPTKKVKHRFGGETLRKVPTKDFKKLMDVQPIAVDPSVNFKSVGGLDTFINKLKEIVLFPILYKEFYAQKGMKPPRGILLHGPPGTGKTLLARALANECANINGIKVSFFLRKGADLLNKFVGESERQLRLLFEQAELHQPSIIFFDEIDGLAPVRSAKSDQIHNSIVSSLLAEIDGLNDRGQIIVMGSTNRLDFVDPALRRPGRFDCELPIFLPTRDGRREILNVHISGWKDQVADEILEELADRTIGFSGADLKFLCWNASMNSLRRTYPQIYTSTQKFLLNYDSINVTLHDWEESLKIVTPSTHRSLFSNHVAAQPLPVFIQPLLQKQVDIAYRYIEDNFPRHSFLVPSIKRLLLATEMDNSGLNSFIVPALLHKLEPLPVFLLSYEGLHLDGFAPEFSVTQKSAEIMKQSSPCVCYIPAIDRLFRLLSDSAKQIITRMLEQSVQKPIFFIGTIEGFLDNVIEDEFLQAFQRYCLKLENSRAGEVKAFFKPVFDQSLEIKTVDSMRKIMEALPLAPPETSVKHKLTEEQLRAIEKNENKLLRELRIFLREMLLKIVRNKKFEEFTKPVDLTEVPDYLDVISNPMDFETMMMKLNKGEYVTARQFRDDIQLIQSNCLAYNPTTTESDKRLRMRAFELVDYSDKLFDHEMDSDFEEECQQINQCRVERQLKPPPEESKNTPSEQPPAEPSQQSTSLNDNSQSQPPLPGPSSSERPLSRKGNRRKSSWAKGVVKKPVKRILLSSSLLDSPLSTSTTSASNETSNKNSNFTKQNVTGELNSNSQMDVDSAPEDQSSCQNESSPLLKRRKSNDARLKQCESELGSLLSETVKFAVKYSKSVVEMVDLRFQFLKLIIKHQYNHDKLELVKEMQLQLKKMTDEEEVAIQRGGVKIPTPLSSPTHQLLPQYLPTLRSTELD